MKDDSKVKISPRRSVGFGGPMMQGGPAEKPKDFRSTAIQLVKYLKPFWVKIALVFIFAIASTLFAIVSPKILGNATNQIVDDYINIQAYNQIMQRLPAGTKLPAGTTGGDVIKKLPASAMANVPSNVLTQIENLDLSHPPSFNFNGIANIAKLLIALYVLSAAFSYIQGWIMSGVSQRITYKLRRDISGKINNMPLSYFDKTTYGEVLSRVTNDVDTVSQTLNQSLSQIVTSVVMILGISGMMLSISWILTIVTLLILPISFVLVTIILKRSQKQFAEQQKELGMMNGHVEEMYAGHSVMRVFNGEQASIAKFNKINEKLHTSAWKSQFLSGLM